MIFKVLINQMNGFYPHCKQDRYLVKKCPQKVSADVSAPVYLCADDKDALLRCVASFVIAQWKAVFTRMQLFNLPKNDSEQWRQINTMICVWSGLPFMSSSFPLVSSRCLCLTIPKLSGGPVNDAETDVEDADIEIIADTPHSGDSVFSLPDVRNICNGL